MKPSQFLTAEWRKLVMANYIINPALLSAYVPAKTELDFYNNNCYVSLVGFMFREVRVRGLRIPFHIHFPEVNLRFYVRYEESGEWKRGVVFIKEIVPKPAISFVANTFFGERYSTLQMKHEWIVKENELHVKYAWKDKNWHSISVIADKNKQPLQPGSEEEFITQHFWGYTSMKGNRTGEYHVTHPAWEIYPVNTYNIACDFANLYGNDFSQLTQQAPQSVFLAEGSPVEVFNKRII